MGRIWTKVEYRLQIGKQSILANHASFMRKQTPVATFIEDTNGMLLKHQKGILNRWREYFCQLLNAVTVKHLKTSKKQFGEETHLTEAEVSTAIKSLKAGKAPGEDDIRPENVKGYKQLWVRWLTRVCQVPWKTGEVPKQWQTSVLIPYFFVFLFIVSLYLSS